METQTQTQSPSQKDARGTKFLAGVGILALLVAAVWLGIQAVQFGSTVTSGLANSFSGVRALFGRGEELVLAVDPGVIASTDKFVLSWEHKDKDEEGSYIFTYECTPGVHLESPISTNNGNVVFCNTPFEFLNNDNNLELSAVTENEDQTKVVMQISFTPNDSEKIAEIGETTVTVVDDPARIANIAGTATTTKDSSEDSDDSDDSDDSEGGDTSTPVIPPVVTPGPPSFVTETIDIIPINDPNGTPDLTVRILQFGTVTKSGVFTAKSGKLNPDDRLAVRFEVVNNGTKDSGTWNFDAHLPTEPRHTYGSRNQESLFPGVRVEYTLGFDRVEDDDEKVRFRVEVDPDEKIDESDENNNSASISLDIEV